MRGKRSKQIRNAIVDVYNAMNPKSRKQVNFKKVYRRAKKNYTRRIT